MSLKVKNKVKVFKAVILATLFITGTISTTAFAWGSTKYPTVMDTHKMISQQAVAILEKDWSNTENPKMKDNLDIIKNSVISLNSGSVWPDFDPNGYKLYQDHFYNPITGNNYSKDISWYIFMQVQETAASQADVWMKKAIETWKQGDHEKAVFELGAGLHYFEDLTNPHHASGWTNVESPSHGKFETYVDSKINLLKIDSNYKTNTGYYKEVINIDKYPTIDSFLATHCYNSAVTASNSKDKVTMKTSWDDWWNAAQITTNDAQKNTAFLIYRFLYEVSK